MEHDEHLTRLLDVNEAAELLGASPYTIRSWIRKGILAATKLGRLVRIQADDLDRFIQKGKVQ